MNNVLKKYKKYLSLFSEHKNPIKQWIKVLEDIMAEIDVESDYNFIRYSAVFTKNEWENFVNHPQRIPYKSKITDLPNNPEEKFVFILKLINDSLKLIDSLEKDQFHEELKITVASLLSSAIASVYDIKSMRIADSYVGRSIEERDNGVVNPTEFIINRLKFAIKQYANSININTKQLEKEIFDICDGRVSILFEYYSNCNIDKSFRDKIIGILEILRRDKTLSYEEVQLGWEMWKKIRTYTNLNLEKILEINNYPSYKIIKNRLQEFLQNKQFAKEMENHLKDELPKNYAFYKKNGYVNFDDLIAEEAERKNYPKKLKNLFEIKKMIKECEVEVSKHIPLIKVRNEKNIILNPIHPESNRRAFQSSTLNKNKERVSVIYMSPRSSAKDDYLRTLAHEAAHAIHRIILEMAENANIIEEGSSQKILGSVMEEFSLLVDSKFSGEEELPYKKKFKGKEFADFGRGLSIRHQAPFGLIQLEVRKYYDKLWDQGYKEELTFEMLQHLENELNKNVKDWYETGIKIKRDRISAFSLFKSERIDDGLVYLKKYIVKNENFNLNKSAVHNETETKNIDIKTAFNKRFGENWISQKDARAMMMWLMLETGRNQKTEIYDEIILKKDIQECLNELYKINIPYELI